MFVLEGVPTTLLGIACLFFLTDRPAEANWLTAEQRGWLVPGWRRRRRAKSRSVISRSGSLRGTSTSSTMALVCSAASATGSVFSVWQPQILKSFGLTNLATGFVNSIPYGIATVVDDSLGPALGYDAASAAGTLHSASSGSVRVFGAQSNGSAIAPTIFAVSCCLVGAYSFKGPFWALSAGWLSASTLAAGLAGINAIANLIGGGLMVNAVGLLKEWSGSYAIGCCRSSLSRSRAPSVCCSSAAATPVKPPRPAVAA